MAQRPKAWEDILKFGDLNIDTIVVGDFNAHRCVWNCQDINRNGEYLYEVMLNKGFICINKDTMTRINYERQTPTNIDLIFANNNLPNIIEYSRKGCVVIGPLPRRNINEYRSRKVL